MFVNYSDCLKIQKAIDGGVTAEAEIGINFITVLILLIAAFFIVLKFI